MPRSPPRNGERHNYSAAEEAPEEVVSGASVLPGAMSREDSFLSLTTAT